MEPFSIALGVIGLGMQIFGGAKQSSNAAQQSQVSQDEARQEQAISGLKQQQMEMDARRQQLEQMRNMQKVQALDINNATNQNAQFGSGLQGGLAAATNQSVFNLQGINGALTIGRGIAGYNNNITQDKIQMAGLQGQTATDQGITSLGGAIMKAGPMIGQMAKGFGGSGSIGMFSDGGNNGMAPTWS